MKRTLIAALLSASVGAGVATAQESVFGNQEDQDYAALVWAVMEQAKLAGDGAIMSFPYEGIEPHGLMLETFYTDATIEGHTGELIVKKNYGPEGVSADEVLMDPKKHLGSYTIMFRREAGYDSDNQDWFWAKYLPDGSLDQNPAGRLLAGRVAKGADAGCIACHVNAGGDDYVFTSDAGAMMDK